MGFWKDLMDATPGKTSARANELHSCGINSKIEIPSVMYDRVYDCSICKVRFGEILAKNSLPILINTNVTPSFAKTESGVVVCHKCVQTFGF